MIQGLFFFWYSPFYSQYPFAGAMSLCACVRLFRQHDVDDMALVRIVIQKVCYLQHPVALYTQMLRQRAVLWINDMLLYKAVRLFLQCGLAFGCSQMVVIYIQGTTVAI